MQSDNFCPEKEHFLKLPLNIVTKPIFLTFALKLTALLVKAERRIPF